MGAIGLLRRELYKAMKARELLKKKKKVVEEIDPITEALMEIVDGQLPLMVHVHKADDVLILKRLIDEFGINAIANHCADIYSESVWKKIKRAGLPVIYGPIDSFAYKVELKHGSWKNVEQLVKIAPKFGLMSDHPVTCQRNFFLQLRYFVRFGMSRAEAIGIITRNNAEILGLKDLGTVENGKLASLVLWNEDPFKLESYPLMAIGEGDILYSIKSD
jgi:imidazolonepropionase-like amidohydrolase